MIRVTVSVTTDQFIDPVFATSLNAALPLSQPRYDPHGNEFLTAYRALIRSVPKIVADKVPDNAPMVLREFDLPDADALMFKMVNSDGPFTIDLSEVTS